MRAGHQLTVVVVVRAFVERLGNPLRDAAMELTVDDQRVDDVADIVDRDVSDRLDLTRIAIDLDHADVRAERERAVRRIVVGRLIEERLHPARQVVGDAGRERDLLDRLRRCPATP